jgi:hypothetical protein
MLNIKFSSTGSGTWLLERWSRWLLLANRVNGRFDSGSQIDVEERAVDAIYHGCLLEFIG